VTALTSRQRELLAAVSEQALVWVGVDLWDERSDAALPGADVSRLYELEMAGLVQLGSVPRPHLTVGGELLLAERREPVGPPWGRGWLLAVAMSLASAGVAVLAVWLIFGVWT
jgi:hypothetical protein